MNIHHVAISVRDLEKSVKFYLDTFGFEVEKRYRRDDLGGSAVLMGLGRTRIELWQFDEPKARHDDPSDLTVLGLKHIAFGVSDIHVTCQQLREQGVSVTEPQLGASGRRYAFLADPDGLPIELYEEPGQ